MNELITCMQAMLNLIKDGNNESVTYDLYWKLEALKDTECDTPQP